MSTRITRRSLLKGAAVAAGAALGARAFGVPALLADPSPNSKLATAVIGVANQGKVSVTAAVTERMVADGRRRRELRRQVEGVHRRAQPGDQDLRHQGLLRLPQAVRRDGTADRRGLRGRAGPPSRGGGDDRHQAGQARLRGEAAGPFDRGGPPADGGRQAVQGRHPDGQPRAQRGGRPPAVRVSRRRGDRRRDGDLQLGPHRPRRAGRAAAHQARARRTALGRSGSARPPIAPTTRSCTRSNGGPGGSSATAPWATGAATTWTGRSWP